MCVLEYLRIYICHQIQLAGENLREEDSSDALAQWLEPWLQVLEGELKEWHKKTVCYLCILSKQFTVCPGVVALQSLQEHSFVSEALY